MTNTARLLFFLLCAFLCGESVMAQALPKAKDSVLLNLSSDRFRLLLHGAGATYGWANTELAVNKKQPLLFCQPENLTLNTDNFIHITKSELENGVLKGFYDKWPHAPEELAILALKNGLIATFPCK